MNKEKAKQIARSRRRRRIGAKVYGAKDCLRLSVFKSNTSMYLQLVDDEKGRTIVSAHSREIKQKADKVKASFELGKLIAKKALDQKIEKIVFDRGGYKYHGRVKGAADGARQGGLKF